jgi:hypothetical protein
VRGLEEVSALLDSLDLARAVPVDVPLLVLDPRDDARSSHGAVAALLAARPRAALLALPGGHDAPLARPWIEAVAAWVRAVASGR